VDIEKEMTNIIDEQRRAFLAAALKEANDANAEVERIKLVPPIPQPPSTPRKVTNIKFGKGPKPAGMSSTPPVRLVASPVVRVVTTAPLPPNVAPIAAGGTAEPTLRAADTIAVEVIEWAWKDWLALGKLHVIAGGKSDGKSTLLLSLGATVTTGGKWPDGTKCERPGYLVIWSGEDGVADTIIPRLMLMGADLKRVFILDGAKNPDGTYKQFDPTADIGRLDAEMEKLRNSGPILLVIDPIVSVVPTKKAGAMHQNNDVREALAPLARIAAKYNAVAVGVTHHTKGTKGGNPIERITGSLAFGAAARVTFVTMKKPSSDAEDGKDESERVVMRTASNIGPSSGGFHYALEIEELPGYKNKAGEPVKYSRVVWGEPKAGNARDVLAEFENPEREDEAADVKTKSGRCAEAMREILSGSDGKGEGVASADVKTKLAAAGFSAKAIQMARERLKVVHWTTPTSPPKTFWRLPDGAMHIVPPIVSTPPVLPEGAAVVGPSGFDKKYGGKLVIPPDATG
jgi:putative DNA primase/helicase